MSIVAAVLLLIAGSVALTVLYYPLIADLVTQVAEDRQARRLRESQQLAEARLRLLTLTTLRQMQEVVRDHRTEPGQ